MKQAVRNFSWFTGLFFVVLLVFSPFNLIGETTASWTFMIYLDADNNLDSASVQNVASMVNGMAPGSNVNVILLWDRFDAPAGIYQVTSEGSVELEALGEVDMDNPQTLHDFIKYAISEFPAEHYFLDLWNHGGGVFGVCTDDESTEYRILRPFQVKDAIAQACSETNAYIDVVGFDACVMSMVEVGYELKDVTDIVVASEMNIPFYGWPYEALMAFLSLNPGVDPYTLSEELTRLYVDFYPKNLVQLSAIDLDLLVEFVKSLDDLAVYLTLNMDGYFDEIKAARREALFEPTAYKNYNSFVDVYRFAYNLTQSVTQKKLVDLADQVMKKLEKAVFANEYTMDFGRLETRVYGFSIFFPNTEPLYTPNYPVYVPEFTNDTLWVDFLFAFFVGKK